MRIEYPNRQASGRSLVPTLVAVAFPLARSEAAPSRACAESDQRITVCDAQVRETPQRRHLGNAGRGRGATCPITAHSRRVFAATLGFLAFRLLTG